MFIDNRPQGGYCGGMKALAGAGLLVLVALLRPAYGGDEIGCQVTYGAMVDSVQDGMDYEELRDWYPAYLSYSAVPKLAKEVRRECSGTTMDRARVWSVVNDLEKAAKLGAEWTLMKWRQSLE